MKKGIRELLFSVTKKDFRVETFPTSTKAGGQKRDKTAVAVRITHPESGAVAQCQDTRSQSRNKKIAFQRLLETAEWKLWYRIKCGLALEDVSVRNKRVEQQLAPENLKVEKRENDEWVDWSWTD